MSEIKHAVDCSCVICEPDDEWTYTEESIPPHPLCCSECKDLRAAFPALVEAALSVHATLDEHLHLGKPLEREMLYAHRDALAAVLVAAAGESS